MPLCRYNETTRTVVHMADHAEAVSRLNNILQTRKSTINMAITMVVAGGQIGFLSEKQPRLLELSSVEEVKAAEEAADSYAGSLRLFDNWTQKFATMIDYLPGCEQINKVWLACALMRPFGQPLALAPIR